MRATGGWCGRSVTRRRARSSSATDRFAVEGAHPIERTAIDDVRGDRRGTHVLMAAEDLDRAEVGAGLGKFCHARLAVADGVFVRSASGRSIVTSGRRPWKPMKVRGQRTFDSPERCEWQRRRFVVRMASVSFTAEGDVAGEGATRGGAIGTRREVATVGRGKIDAGGDRGRSDGSGRGSGRTETTSPWSYEAA
jgi:hypothetical protein